MSKILSVNAGSSSLKFQLLEMPSAKVLTEGVIERIGQKEGVFTMKFNGKKTTFNEKFPTHKEAVNLLLDKLVSENVVDSLEEINGCGHRVVHGGEEFGESSIITEEVAKKIEMVSSLAPLHNPANLIGYRTFQEALPNIGHVAVFDTAFHQTIKEEAFTYPIPTKFYNEFGIRKYGFHGTSHLFISKSVEKLEGKGKKVISLHLGNGGSLCAIKDGISIDTSMGFTPLAGIMMGTRSGDIDPAIVWFLADKLNKSAGEIGDILNTQSGFLGISEISSDSRDISDAISKGDKKAILAQNVYIKTICDYIGSYIIALGGVDVIVFTAGIGENAPEIRKEIIEKISEATGAKIDDNRNNIRGKETLISSDDSACKIYLIPTNEELVIAQDTARLLGL